MRYFVVADDGGRYGPADVETLNSWIQEGRLLRATLLEEEGSGARVAASAVAGLNFPPVAAPSPPTPGPVAPGPIAPGMGSPYSAPPSSGPGVGPGFQNPPGYMPMDNGNNENLIAWILGGAGILCCGIGWILGGVGAFLASKAKAKGNPNAQGAFIFNIVVAIFSALGCIGYFVMIAFLAASGAAANSKFQNGLQQPPSITFPSSGTTTGQ